MEVGDRDLYNPNVMRDNMHDWVLANENMANVLAAKGYHYQFVFAAMPATWTAQRRRKRCLKPSNTCGRATRKKAENRRLLTCLVRRNPQEAVINAVQVGVPSR